MSDAHKAAAIQRAEKLLKPKPSEPTFVEHAAEVDKQRRADEEKTKRLRALRLAKEAAEGNGSGTKRGRRRNNSAS